MIFALSSSIPALLNIVLLIDLTLFTVPSSKALLYLVSTATRTAALSASMMTFLAGKVINSDMDTLTRRI